MAATPAYIKIAGQLTQRIRSGDLEPGAQLPSHDRLAEEHGVSEIVIRHAIGLLVRSGLVYSVPRRGNFVADRPALIRVSPERQKESAETSFGNESRLPVDVHRTVNQVRADADQAEMFGVQVGAAITHTVTTAREDGKPISISDTFEPSEGTDPVAVILEETLEHRIPAPAHSAWLEIPETGVTSVVRQRYLNEAGRLIMTSEVTYSPDRYSAFTFLMVLPTEAQKDHP